MASCSGVIYIQNKQLQKAISVWVTSYRIAKQIGLAEILEELSKLAPRLGLPEGFKGWEKLARWEILLEKLKGFILKKPKAKELRQVKLFVRTVVQAYREKSDETGKCFESVSKMATDPNTLPKYQELGKVLQDYMAGNKSPDLSRLTGEFAEIVRNETEK